MKFRTKKKNYESLQDCWNALQQRHSEDWLASMEILEILLHENLQPILAKEIRKALTQCAEKEKSLTKLITDGLALIDAPEIKLVVH